MKTFKLMVVLMVAVAGIGFAKAENSKFYNISTTVTVEPGKSVDVTLVDGLIKVDGINKPAVPEVVNSAPEWLKSDLALAFEKLAKSPDRIGKDAYITATKYDGKETLVISGSGKRPSILTLPDYTDISSILPANIDPTARIAIADVDADGNTDMIVCPKNNGYFYLLGPDFTVATKSGSLEVNTDVVKQPMFPVTTIGGTPKFASSPKGFGYWNDNGNFAQCKQENFVMPLPNAYGVMTSMGLFYIDGNGDLRLFDARLTNITSAKPSGYSSIMETGLPVFDGEVHLAFDTKRILASTIDGDLFSNTLTKDGWKTELLKTNLVFKKKLSVQISEGNLYYLDSSSKNIMFSKGSDWKKADKLDVTSDTPFAVGDVNGDKIADMAVVNGNKLTILAGPDFKKTLKTIEETIDKKINDKETQKIPVIDKGSSPAFGDVNFDGKPDLLVGNKDGQVMVWLAPNFEKSDMFAWVDVGEFSAPQVGDVDGDGTPDLLIANVDGRLFCYRKNGDNWQEWKSWSFIPSYSQSVASDYFNSYMLDAPLVQWKDDPQTVQVYASQLENCDPKMFDEIAFVIAQTSPEILRTMSRMGQANIVSRNAKTIYDYAPTLPYLKLVEKPDYTTISYKVAGKEVELPRDDYYWYVVHPRILFELPIGIDCSWWDRSADDRGMSIEDWWKHEENFYVGKSVFWREAYKDDKTYGESVLGAAQKSATYEDAMKNVFWLKGLGKDRLFTFGYLTNDIYPWQIFKKHYGSCGENSIVFASMARAALLPCYVAIDQGEDHQWNEVWMPDGWRHVEPSSGELAWDQPWGSTEGRKHEGKTVSTVVGWRGDDLMFPTTTTVHVPESDKDYTKSGKGYTDTASVSFKIIDAVGKPVEGGIVIIRSGWNSSNNVSIWNYTNARGIARFELGYEPYYVIDVVTPAGITGLSRFVVKELQSYEVTLKVPGTIKSSMTELPETLPTGTNVVFESVTDEQRPMNFRTSRGYRLGGYLFENYGHHGPLFFRQPVEAIPTAVKIGSNKFQAGQGKTFGLTVGQTMTITNDSLYTYKTVTVKFTVPITDYKLNLTAKSDKTEVASGESFTVSGKIDHSTPLTKLEYSWDGKIWTNVAVPADKWLSEFTQTIETGANGPMSPGDKTLTLRAFATTPEGDTNSTTTIKIKVNSTSKFANQPISQDEPNPLTDAKWRLVDFTIPEGEKYLLIQTSTKAANLDLDMFLYLDSNGNGKPDDGEEVSNSAGGTAFERILLVDPKTGPYILIIHGYSVPDPDTRFDLKMSVAPNW